MQHLASKNTARSASYAIIPCLGAG